MSHHSSQSASFQVVDSSALPPPRRLVIESAKGTVGQYDVSTFLSGYPAESAQYIIYKFGTAALCYLSSQVAPFYLFPAVEIHERK